MKKLLFSLIIIFFTIINVQAEDSNYLANLSVDGYSLNPTFDKDTYEYIITVKDNVSSVIINADALSMDSIITGTGKANLTGETSVFLITVTQDTNIKTYKLTVIQSESNNYLKSLKAGKYELDQPFDKNTFSYSVTVPYEVTSINVPAIAESSTSTVTVKGHTDLNVGENNIIITVTSDTGKARVYEITVFRTEEIIPEEVTTTNSNSTNNNDISVDTKTVETKEINNQTTINYRTIIIIGSLFIILVVGGLSIYYFYKHKGEIEEEEE